MKKLIVSATFLLINFMSSSVFAQNKIDEGWINWTNFKKYVNQNKEVKEKQKGELSIVFLGDSIFEGWSVARPDFFKDKPYYNRGISGQVTAQMLLRFQEDVANLKPDVLVLKAGINDIAENAGVYDQEKTLNNIKSIVQLAKANKIKVVLCSVLPANRFVWRPALTPADKVIDLNTALKAYAKQENVLYLDLYAAVVDDKKGMKSAYANDGVHPTVEGYKVLEPIVEQAISKVKK
jgi:lysophospholipase L1-like esterase